MDRIPTDGTVGEGAWLASGEPQKPTSGGRVDSDVKEQPGCRLTDVAPWKESEGVRKLAGAGEGFITSEGMKQNQSATPDVTVGHSPRRQHAGGHRTLRRRLNEGLASLWPARLGERSVSLSIPLALHFLNVFILCPSRRGPENFLLVNWTAEFGF